jgi:DNA-binding transcriptional MerR regulator
MSKSIEAFRTISEVADDLDVPKHVLRFWEVKFPQIRPMKRGGGRRYYRPEDLVLLRGIQRLLHAEGYTIKGVQKILREHGVEQVKLQGLTAIAEREAALKGGRRVTAAPTLEPLASAGRVRALGGSGRMKKAARADVGIAVEHRALIEAAIGELTSCRDRLAGRTAAAPGRDQVVRRAAR